MYVYLYTQPYYLVSYRFIIYNSSKTNRGEIPPNMLLANVISKNPFFTVLR